MLSDGVAGALAGVRGGRGGVLGASGTAVDAARRRRLRCQRASSSAPSASTAGAIVARVRRISKNLFSLGRTAAVCCDKTMTEEAAGRALVLGRCGDQQVVDAHVVSRDRGLHLTQRKYVAARRTRRERAGRRASDPRFLFFEVVAARHPRRLRGFRAMNSLKDAARKRNSRGMARRAMALSDTPAQPPSAARSVSTRGAQPPVHLAGAVPGRARQGGRGWGRVVRFLQLRPQPVGRRRFQHRARRGRARRRRERSDRSRS